MVKVKQRCQRWRQILTPCSWFPAARRRPFSPLPFLVRGFLAGKKGTRFDPKNPTIPHLSPGKCNCSTGLTTCFSFKKKRGTFGHGFKPPPNSPRSKKKSHPKNRRLRFLGPMGVVTLVQMDFKVLLTTSTKSLAFSRHVRGPQVVDRSTWIEIDLRISGCWGRRFIEKITVAPR